MHTDKRYDRRKVNFIKENILSQPHDTTSELTVEDYQYLEQNVNDFETVRRSNAFKKVPYGYGPRNDATCPTPLDGELTREWLLENYHYEPHTGHLIIKRSCYESLIGTVVTKKQTKGYPYITVNKRNYLVHRVAWLMQTGSWPTKWLDHINGNPEDNRWSNLREASHQENLRYRPAPKNNTTGYKNIHLKVSPKTGKSYYKVVIMLNKYEAKTTKTKYQQIARQFKTIEDALTFRDEQLIKHFGEFAYLDYPVGHPKHMPFNK